MNVSDIPDSIPWTFRIAAAIFFMAVSAVFGGLMVAMWYEAYAILTRLTPTISYITSWEYLKHPVWWVVILGLVMYVAGALTAHFTHWTP